jgi:hypothetical protein
MRPVLRQRRPFHQRSFPASGPQASGVHRARFPPEVAQRRRRDGRERALRCREGSCRTVDCSGISRTHEGCNANAGNVREMLTRVNSACTPRELSNENDRATRSSPPQSWKQAEMRPGVRPRLPRGRSEPCSGRGGSSSRATSPDRRGTGRTALRNGADQTAGRPAARMDEALRPLLARAP